jgi:hypothetical protein
MPCRGSRRVARLDCSLRDAWPSPRVVWACLSLPECFLSLPHPSLSLGSCESQRVLECLGLSLACGRAGDDGDVMAAQLVRLALRLLARRATCMAASCCILRDVEIRSSSRIGGVARVVRLGPHTSQSRTCRARWRVVVRGGDLSCEGSSSGKLIRDAAIWPRTGRLTSEGHDEDLHAFPEMQHQVKGGLLLDVVVSKGTTILELLASKQLTPPRGLWFCRC